jgi:putative tricarboxylic transport membrane protein
MLFFGVLGWIMRKFGYEAAPMVLAYVLGPQMENALRQSLLISQGSFLIFFTRPISGIAMGFAFLLLMSNLFPYFQKRRQAYEKFKE